MKPIYEVDKAQIQEALNEPPLDIKSDFLMAENK